MDDSALLGQFAQAGSQAAFRDLVGRYTNLVYASALTRLRDAHAAQDVTQAVFLTLALKAKDLRPDTSLPGWLFTTTRYVAARYQRGEQRRQERDMRAFEQHQLHQPEAPAAVWEELQPHLAGALDSLSGADREAVLLRFYRQASHRQIAEQLRISEDAAAQRIHRALDKLRRLFAKKGVTLSVAALAGGLTASASAAPAGLAGVVSGAVLTGAGGTLAATETLMLANGVMHMMFIAQVKTVSLAAAACLVVAGTGVIVTQQLAAPPTATQSVAAPAVAVPAPKPTTEVSPTASPTHSEPAAAPTALSSVTRPPAPSVNEYVVQQTAQLWVSALLAGRVDQVMTVSDVPFSSEGKNTVRTTEDLRRTIEGLIQAKGVRNLQVGDPTLMKGAELDLFQNLATNGLAVVQVHVFPLKAGQATVPTVDGVSVSVPAGLLEWVESYLVAIKPGTESKVVGAVIATRATVQMAAQKTRCLNTVKQICVALVAFADEHQGRLPQSLDQLALGKQMLRCPTAAADAAPHYEFLISGARLADIKKPSETVMVREINASHDGQRVVGFADAHVEVVKP